MNGQYGPDAQIDTLGDALIGAAVSVPAGYTASLDGLGNLTITGPATDALTYTITPVGKNAISRTVVVPPLPTQITAAIAALQTHTSFFDDFTRSDASTLGSNYAAQNNISVVSNRAQISAATTGFAVKDIGSYSVDVAATMSTSPDVPGTQMGVCARWTDFNNHIRVGARGGTYQRIAGGSVVFQQLTTGGNWNPGDEMRLVIVGVSVRIYKAGTLVLAFTDPGAESNQTTRHGVYAAATGFSVVEFDNLAVVSL